jgi:cytochrome c553
MPARFLYVAKICCVVLALVYQTSAFATPEQVDELIRTALMLDSHPEKGAIVYKNNCARCHGQNGAGHADGGVPTLAAQRQSYLVKQLADFSLNDRDSSTMHGVIARKSVNDPQTWIDVAAFINSLSPFTSVQNGKDTNLALGEAIFREQCSSCHDEDARGDDDGFVPALRNQHYSYLLRQMRALINGHRRNVDPDLGLFLASIKDDEMQATADYLSRLSGPTKDHLKMRQNGVTSD